MKLSTVTALSLLIAFLGLVCASQESKKPAQIRIAITVESEGPQGLWAQSAEDPAKAELQEPRGSSRWNSQSKKDLTIVTKDDPHDMLGLSIVAEKVGKRPGSGLFVVSSALVIAKKNGDDIFASHDVIAGSDLDSVAKGVAFYLASAKLRLMTGMIGSSK